MKKRMSFKQIEANRRNGSLSTGPKTPNGKAVSRMNALKHGLRSADVVVRGRCIRESHREFAAFSKQFWEDLQPEGMLEEILVEQIITTVWRLRRVRKAESGEIALNVDNGEWNRKTGKLKFESMSWGIVGDPVADMRDSAFGNTFLHMQLREVRSSVEKEGRLTEAAIQSVVFKGEPYSLTRKLERLYAKLQQNPDALDESALQSRQKEQALDFIDRELSMASRDADRCEKREWMEEEARQAVDVLPSADKLDKLLRYETTLQRSLFRAMNRLERLQRRRLGENVPPPQIVEFSNGT